MNLDRPYPDDASDEIKRSETRSQANQYAELKRLVKQEGLLDQQPAYFAVGLGRFGGHLEAWDNRVPERSPPDAENQTAIPTGIQG